MKAKNGISCEKMNHQEKYTSIGFGELGFLTTLRVRELSAVGFPYRLQCNVLIINNFNRVPMDSAEAYYNDPKGMVRMADQFFLSV